jgi:thymidylate kinase
MYRQLAAASPESWLVINAEQAPDPIARQVWQGVQATELIA